MAIVTVTVLVEDQLAAPVDGVLVRVFEADGTTYVTEGLTGTPTPGSGQVEFSLNGDNPAIDYVIRLALDGSYWPGGATQTISVSDPPAPDNDFGPYALDAGPSQALVTFAVQDDELVPNDLEGVKVRVYDAGDAFVLEGLTDANGKLVAFLDGSSSPGTPYIVRLFKAGYTFPVGATQTVAVIDPVVPPDTNVFDFVASAFTYPTATDPNYCRISGYFVNVSGQPAKKLRLEFKPCPNFPTAGNGELRESSRLIMGYNSYPALVDGKILSRSVKVDTDANGFFSVDLPREGIFDVHVHGFEDPIEITERIFVPDAASARAEDVFYPYIQAVTYSADPINVAVGEEVEVDITLTMSNGETIDDQRTVLDLIEFVPVDDTIATVTLSSAGQLTVKGLAAGSTTVEATRKAINVVPSRPDVPNLVVTAPTVTVT